MEMGQSPTFVSGAEFAPPWACIPARTLPKNGSKRTVNDVKIRIVRTATAVRFDRCGVENSGSSIYHLTELVHRTRPDKYVTLRFGGVVSATSLETLGGRVVSHGEGHAVLQVDAATMKSVVAGALANLPVIDLKVEDAPIEEVLADVFAEGERAG